jgi:hypothetical protein
MWDSSEKSLTFIIQSLHSIRFFNLGLGRHCAVKARGPRRNNTDILNNQEANIINMQSEKKALDLIEDTIFLCAQLWCDIIFF